LIACAIAGSLIRMLQIPWSQAMHAQMHWRPDAITRTGVIQPMWARQVSPVDMARHTIDPFIASVRGPGPAVSPYPSPEDVAYAAGKLAQLFARGKSGTVCLGTEKITVGPDTPVSGGIVGTITQAAQELARGGTVTIQIGARRVIVCNSGPGGEPEIKPSGATNTSVPVRSEQQTATAPSSPAPAKSGWGDPPMFAPTMLPQIPGPGNVPQSPFLDYAAYYRNLQFDENVWQRRNFRASIASRFAPNAIAAMNAANSVPIHNAQRQAMPALQSRSPMVQKRYPEPPRVFPSQATVNVRKEQR
jgi:hypothetical protein